MVFMKVKFSIMFMKVRFSICFMQMKRFGSRLCEAGEGDCSRDSDCSGSLVSCSSSLFLFFSFSIFLFFSFSLWFVALFLFSSFSLFLSTLIFGSFSFSLLWGALSLSTCLDLSATVAYRKTREIHIHLS